jgi:ABC-2 type transport system permease protein
MRERLYPPVIELTLARLLEFVREPEAVFWTVVFPLALAFALGVAFRNSSDAPVFAGVLEGQGSAEVSAALGRAPEIRPRILTEQAAGRALRNGDVEVVVVPGTPPTYRFDPSRPESQRARLAVDAALQRAAGREDRFSARQQPVQVVGGRYIDWLVPGLLGMNIMGTGMWSIGFSVVWARTKKVLKRFAATPMRRRDYLFAQLLARLVFLAGEVAALLGFAVLAFSVPIRGSLVTVAVVAILGALAFGGLGLLVASRARTIEAVSGWMNFAMLPMWVVSGVFFSSSHFPSAMQPFIQALPLTALNNAFRSVMLDGASLAGIRGEVAVLAAWTVACFGIALKIFRWK